MSNSNANMQANIARAVKYPGPDARNWVLFFFFRILRKPETQPVPQLLGEIMGASKSVRRKTGSSKNTKSAAENDSLVERAINAVASGLSSAGAFGSVLEEDEERRETNAATSGLSETLQPAEEFFAWLRRVSGSGVENPSAKGDTANAEIDSRVGTELSPQKIHAHLEALLSAKKSDFDADKLKTELFGLLMRPKGPVLVVTRILALILGNLTQPEKLGAVIRTVSELGEGLQQQPKAAATFLFILSAYFKVLVSSPDLIAKLLAKFKGDAGAAGLAALNGGLPMVAIYEILRQSAPSLPQMKKKGMATALLRDEASQSAGDASAKLGTKDIPVDPMPINIAFSYPGLEMLNLDPETLESFPDAFKEGMAARAERLGDTGANAPENWDGALGLRSVHGHFSSRFLIGDDRLPMKEEPWRRLREDVRLFNNRSGPRGRLLRALIAALFRPLGMEILHLELGQDPYRTQGDDRKIVPERYRREHFGFRDGISQPFIDMNLGTPPAGGGTPRRNRTWDNVAKGEIFLDEPDEDGNIQVQPANKKLRADGTYQVFRKLEQDVIGFRNFLKGQRPTTEGQERLAAQFMGRWKDGTPLTVSPDREIELGEDRRGQTNDFLYAKDDPNGKKCPLGSHVRRSNPRDIGGNADAKRHRILRRGIAYGGSLLPDDSNGDGEERGLLFVAVNARIDLQFELIQSNWINNGEFLGQAGLGKCPVTGSNNAGSADRFFEAGAIAPVHHIPRFVTTRGGDYFFIPSVDALKAIAAGEKFPPEKDWPGRGWLDDVVTPSLIQESRIKYYARRIIKDGDRKIVIKPPETPSNGRLPTPHEVVENPHAGNPITFVGRHADVKRVLQENSGDLLFSVRHYRDASRRTTRGYDLLIGTELGTKVGGTRQRLQKVLELVWNDFSKNADFYGRLQKITDESIASAMNRTAQRGQIDLVRDLATDTVYRIVSELFGVPGPDWITEIAIALPFARKQVGDLERDWLSTINGEKPENPGLATLQLWSVIFLADLVGNHLRLGELNELARSSGAEFMNHLEKLLAKARTQRTKDPDTLLEAFVKLEGKAIEMVRKADSPAGNSNYSSEEYYSDVLVLLLELVGTPMSVIPTAWGNVIGAILNLSIDLPTLLAILGNPEPPMIIEKRKVKRGPYSWITQLLYEVDRLNPSFSVFMRRSEKENDFGDGLTIDEGHWVAAMAIAANLDPRVHDRPREFSLYPFLPGPKRNPADYLMFGSAGGGRDCWGRDKLSLYLLDRFVRACAQLDGLQKVAGPHGDPIKLLRVTIGQPARFAKQRIRPVA